MEPQWSRGISSNTVCSTYYFIFVLYAIVALVAIMGTVSAIVGLKMQKGMALAFGFLGLLTASLAATLALFQYLVCSRALLGGNQHEGFFASTPRPVPSKASIPGLN